MECQKIDLQTMIIYLSKLKKSSLKVQAKLLKPYNLSSRHAGYIMALSEGKGMTMKALSDTLCVDPANTTRVIAALTEKGYVANDCPKEGCRKFNVFLTPEGRQIADSIRKDVANCGAEFMNALTDEEKKQFVILLYKMAKDCDEN